MLSYFPAKIIIGNIVWTGERGWNLTACSFWGSGALDFLFYLYAFCIPHCIYLTERQWFSSKLMILDTVKALWRQWPGAVFFGQAVSILSVGRSLSEEPVQPSQPQQFPSVLDLFFCVGELMICHLRAEQLAWVGSNLGANLSSALFLTSVGCYILSQMQVGSAQTVWLFSFFFPHYFAAAENLILLLYTERVSLSAWTGILMGK